MTASKAFALALRRMDNVGRVTASRLFAHFATYEDLRDYPREQVLVRIKGAPNTEALVRRLFDEQAMEARLEEAQQTLSRLRDQKVELLTPRDAHWPAGLNDLPRSQRPFLMHAYGDLRALKCPVVALFARPPLSEAAFEMAQALVRVLLPYEVLPATGASQGFDVVVHKIAGDQPSLLVVPAGLGRLAKPLRPAATRAVKAGGLLLSSFPFQHGPYDHDDRERACVMAALAHTCIFVEPRPDTAEWHALEWVLEAGRPAFGIPHAEAPLPERIPALRGKPTFDTVLATLPTERPDVS